jgi:Amt family ammonium transporter
MLGARLGRYGPRGSAFPPSSIPWLSLGSWLLCIGWFGFNVVSAQSLEGISGLVAVNSLMAMVGGLLAALLFGKSDPGFVHNGALAGLVAVCAGSDVMHPIGALVTGAIAGILFVYLFIYCQEKLKVDDVLGVWPLHGLAGAWGGIACGIFGQQALGGLGGVSLTSQIIGTVAGCGFAAISGLIIYGLLKRTIGIRLSEEEERQGADLSIHKIAANPETGLGG